MIIRTSLAAAAALLLSVTATPSLAKDAAKTESAATSSSVSDVTRTPGAPAQADQKKYCMVMDLTGSRVPRKICRTKAEWIAEGATLEVK
jgi:hypothetical protein